MKFVAGSPIPGTGMPADRLAHAQAPFVLAPQLRDLFETAWTSVALQTATPRNPTASLRIMSDQSRPRSRFDSDVSDPPSRSRFDREESDRPSRSRFDRRSRSPSSREPEPRRTRSPIGRSATDSPAGSSVERSAEKSAEKSSKLTGAAAAAAAVAARIAASIQAKKGIQHVDVPPIRSVR
jgi:hypothetical protein